MGWKPIDLAPRDGAHIVVAFRSPMTEGVFVSVASWSGAMWVRHGAGGDDVAASGEIPFAWTELPEAVRPKLAVAQ